MRQHLAVPHFHLLDRHVASGPPVPHTGGHSPAAPSGDDRSQVIKDKLAVAAVLLLVGATLAVFVLYLVQQAPHFGSGEFTAFATPMPGAVQAGAASRDATPVVAGTGLGRVSLILISTVVEMAIFVALGLYLRHDMNRKP